MRRVRTVVAACAAAVLLTTAACGDDGSDAGSEPTHPDADASLDEADAETHGFVRDPAPQVGELSLPDLAANGKEFTFSAPPGGMLLVFFGFTNCPDICPNTMMNLSRVENQLVERDGTEGLGADDVDVAMVTVDPDRDLGSLADYVQDFVPDGHALGTDDPAELQRVADEFGAAYEVAEGQNGPEVGHTDVLYGIDDSGSVVMNWTFGVAPDEIVADLDHLFSEAA